VVLLGRGAERAALDRLLSTVRAGGSAALVVRGEPGVGKTALLEYVVERAAGCRVVRASGVESEIQLAFGALHQLCAALLDRRDALAQPQADLLRERARLPRSTTRRPRWRSSSGALKMAAP
jgi:predicted ATPase